MARHFPDTERTPSSQHSAGLPEPGLSQIWAREQHGGPSGGRDRLSSGSEVLDRSGGERKRIAVIGSGISGLASAVLLSRRHAVTLFEKDERLGGHSNTVDVTLEGGSHPVDTGFLVFNRRTYPNLCALFAWLGVESIESEMSFSVSLREPALEWAGSDLGTVFAQPRNLLRPAFLGMLREILRFNAMATRLATGKEAVPSVALGEYLDQHRYGHAFRNWYLLPMAAAIWSSPTRTILEYPLATFARFCHNHGLLQILDRPRWMTVRGGSRAYVRRMAAMLDDVRTATPVLAVRRDEHGVWIHAGAETERFDDVVFACHSDQALKLLGDEASTAERAILGAVRYQDNRAVLHTDSRLLPRRSRVWSAWNYLAGSGDVDLRPVSVSYLINRLQPLPSGTPVVVSLNPFLEPDPGSVLREFHYAHPVFDQGAIDAQSRLSQIQGRAHGWFAGAWTGYGFHEDGLNSALNVVEALGVEVPWRASVAAEVKAA